MAGADVSIPCKSVLIVCAAPHGAAKEGSSIVSVVGAGIFKRFVTAANSLKLLPTPLAKRDLQNFLAHAGA